MRVTINSDVMWGRVVSELTLILQATCKTDRDTLEDLVASYRVAAFGRHPETNELLHVEIAIERN